MKLEIMNNVIYENGIKIGVTSGSPKLVSRPTQPISIKKLSRNELIELFKTLYETLEGIEWEYRKIKSKRELSTRFTKLKDYVMSLIDYSNGTAKRHKSIAKRLNSINILLDRYPSDGKPVLGIIPTMVKFLFRHYLEYSKYSDYSKRKYKNNFIAENQLVAYTIAYHADKFNIDRNEFGKVWNSIFSKGDNRHSINFSKLPFPLPSPRI